MRLSIRLMPLSQLSLFSLWLLFVTIKIADAGPSESGTQIAISIDAGTGLVYLLLVIFFTVNFCTPIARYIYVNYLASMVEKAAKEVAKAQKKFSERLSDAGRKVSQSVRSA